MHVYHFGAYEPTAFKRLSGRYATRENELDVILRAELFVDLHTIVKHSLRASVETYSIKDLEQFYGLQRAQDLRIATASRRALEWAIEMREDLGLHAAPRRAAKPQLELGFEAVPRRPRHAARTGQKTDSRSTSRSSSVTTATTASRPPRYALARGAACGGRAGERRRAAAARAAFGRGQ
jgi:hypothetical protein